MPGEFFRPIEETQPATPRSIQKLCSTLEVLAERPPKEIDVTETARAFSLFAPETESLKKGGYSIYASYVLGVNGLLVFNLAPKERHNEYNNDTPIGFLNISYSEPIQGGVQPVVVDHQIFKDRVLRYENKGEDAVIDIETIDGLERLDKQIHGRQQEELLGLPIMTEAEVKALNAGLATLIEEE